MNIQLANKLKPLITEKRRHKVAYGGRGGAKSWGFADALLYHVMSDLRNPKRVLCTRELQNSIKDSVHQLLCDRIVYHKLEHCFKITDSEIRCTNGSMFIFKGLRVNPTELKSIEGIDYCWVEEAEKVSEASWNLLTPTIRKPGSEIWIAFNTGTESDPVWERYVKYPREDTIVIKVNFNDNPWFPDVLRSEMEYDREHNPVLYRTKWLGEPMSGGRFFEEIGTPIAPMEIAECDLRGRLYGSLDSGTSHATSFGLWWISGKRHENQFGKENTIHRMFTYKAVGSTIADHADAIYDSIDSFVWSKGHFPVRIFYDWAMDTQVKLNEYMVRAPIDEYKTRFADRPGAIWTRANKNKTNGCQLMRSLFRVRDNCPSVYYWEGYNADYVSGLRYVLTDENRTEVYAKMDGDDVADEVRYGLNGIQSEIVGRVEQEQARARFDRYNAEIATRDWKEW